MPANAQNNSSPIIIALGGNLPFQGRLPQDTQKRALQLLEQGGATISGLSSFWKSQAWPDPKAPEYINSVATIETSMTPGMLLATMMKIENNLGRVRSERWGPRTIDLDIIDYRGLIQEGADLTLPHPRAHERSFVLLPLFELLPEWKEPGSGRTISQLIAALPAEQRTKTHKIGG